MSLEVHQTCQKVMSGSTGNCQTANHLQCFSVPFCQAHPAAPFVWRAHQCALGQHAECMLNDHTPHTTHHTIIAEGAHVRHVLCSMQPLTAAEFACLGSPVRLLSRS